MHTEASVQVEAAAARAELLEELDREKHLSDEDRANPIIREGWAAWMWFERRLAGHAPYGACTKMDPEMAKTIRGVWMMKARRLGTYAAIAEGLNQMEGGLTAVIRVG